MQNSYLHFLKLSSTKYLPYHLEKYVYENFTRNCIAHENHNPAPILISV